MVSAVEIKDKLKDLKGELKSRYNVKELGLFGSFVRGEASESSDCDLLVEFSPAIGMFKFIELEEFLTSVLGVKVDLVSKKALKPRIGAHILKEVEMV
ncbi:MAG: nucleotidyltransferase family protein [Planctomycetota bacterium]|jgi:predicted nucleotidyltransferase